MIEQVVIDYPGGRAVHVGQVEEGSRDLDLIQSDAWPSRCAGTRKLSRHGSLARDDTSRRGTTRRPGIVYASDLRIR
jgi:hypothetical protein